MPAIVELQRARGGPLAVRTQLAAIIAVSLFVFVALGAFLSVRDVRAARRSAHETTRFQAALAVESVQRAIDDAGRLVVSTASGPDLAQILGATPEECTLAGAGSGVFTAGHLDLFTLDGRVACSSVSEHGAPAGGTFAGVGIVDRLKDADGSIVSAPFADPLAGGALAIAVAAPVHTEGTLSGGFASVLHLEPLASELARTLAGPQGFGFIITDGGGGVISSSHPGLSDVALDSSAGRIPALGGRPALYGAEQMDEPRWRVVATIDESMALQPARTTLFRNATLGAAALGVLILLGFLFSRRIVRPLREIAASMDQAARDVQPDLVEAHGPAELRTLVRSFNQMVEARGRYERALLHQAFHDALTGLPNRALLLDRARTALRRAERAPGSVAMLFVDIDRFKVLNESLSHETGDLILEEIAGRLTEVLRAGDTVARMAADEFVILCEGLVAQEQADAIAERVHACLKTPFETDGGDITLTASIGIALARAATTPEELLRDADAAMAKAKRAGRGRDAYFDDSLRDRAKRRLQIDRELREALAHDELILHYQPVVDLTSGAVCGVEALIRWDHPTQGTVPPMEFIPVAEESDLILEVGRWALEHACSQAVAWRRKGLDVSMAVNLSARQLARAELPSIVGTVLGDTELAPGMLVLEITEGTLLAETAPVQEILTKLKAIGVRISVDDFGIGYSSLAYLRRFPVDQLKIDRAFVEELRPASGRSALCAAIMDMARALTLEVVAEGIEEPVQIAELTRLGCRLGQGYLIARPAPARDVEAVIAEGIPALSTVA